MTKKNTNPIAKLSLAEFSRWVSSRIDILTRNMENWDALLKAHPPIEVINNTRNSFFHGLDELMTNLDARKVTLNPEGLATCEKILAFAQNLPSNTEIIMRWINLETDTSEYADKNREYFLGLLEHEKKLASAG